MITTSEDQADLDLERLAAALASMPEQTVVSYRSAAQLWGMWIPAFDSVEITCPAGNRGSRYTTAVQRGSIVTHRRILGPQDVTEHIGLPVTTPARTWLDLSAVLQIHDLVAAGDSALALGADHYELAERATALHRVRGSVRARQAVPLLSDSSRSRPESRIRAALLLAGLPAPSVNQAVFDEFGQWLAEPDLHYAEAKLAIEYNGAVHATVDRMRKDATRVLDLQRAGWIVLTYTAVDAFSRLDAVVADVRAVLRRRAPQLLVRTHLPR